MSDRKLLKESNDILRSAYQIALRRGRETNWYFFKNKVEEVLKKQHWVMYGRSPLESENECSVKYTVEPYALDDGGHIYFYEKDFYVFSNFSAFKLDRNGIIFDTSEQAYQFEKFSQWPSIQEEILVSMSAHEAFKLAQKYKDKVRPDWDDIKVFIMKDILRCKLNQHKYIQEKLRKTGNRTLIEDSWRDDFWGWGPNRDGKNQLGKLWMEIRDETRNELCKPMP